MIQVLKNLFKKDNPVEEVETAPLSKEGLDTTEDFVEEIKPTQMVVGSGQSVGLHRDHNEDTLFALNAVLADGTSDLAFGIFIVADGMGGHEHGEVASDKAARAMADYLMKKLYSPLLGTGSEEPSESIHEIMADGVQAAQNLVLDSVPGGGTTLTVALVIGDQVTFAHVGDSRAYFIYADRRIEAITHDHSLVQRLVDLGQITEEEAEVHPQRNVLYRALGQTEAFTADVNTYSVPKNGYMLLCSDGLWGLVPEEELMRIVLSAPSLSIACQELVKAANEAGGHDNISAVLVQFLDS